MSLSDPNEKETNIINALVQKVKQLSTRVQHLETLESVNNFAALDKAVLSVDTPLVTFADITGIYIALKIIAFVRTDRAATSDAILTTFNNDAGNNYDSIRASMLHSATLSTNEQIAAAGVFLGPVAGDNAPANVFSALELTIPDYAGANHKSLQGSTETRRANTTGNLLVTSFAGWWRDVEAITEIDLMPNAGTDFLAGSRFYLYGLKASP